jgi:hypothetical protein
LMTSLISLLERRMVALVHNRSIRASVRNDNSSKAKREEETAL